MTKKYTYTVDQLNELEPAYAVTVHKSQGSEFPAVILPVADVPARLCYRNLLYTGVTRARKLCVLTGTARTEQTMVENVRQNMRYSGLRYLLKDAATPTEEKQEQLSGDVRGARRGQAPSHEPPVHPRPVGSGLDRPQGAGVDGKATHGGILAIERRYFYQWRTIHETIRHRN